MSRVVYLNLTAVGEIYLVNDARYCGNKVEVVFSLKALLNYLKVEQAEESAAESEAERSRGFGLIAERSVVELELVESIAQVFIVRAVCGVDTAEYHRIYLPVAGKGLGSGIFDCCHRVADSRVADSFYARGDVADLAGAQLAPRLGELSPHIAGLDHIEFCACGHESHRVAGFNLALFYSDIDNDALVAVIDRVENQSAAGERIIRFGGRNEFNNLLEHFLNVFARLCGNSRRLGAVKTDDILNLFRHSVGVGGGEVYFIDYRHYLEIVIEREVGVCESLRLNALRGIDNQYRALASGE